MLDHASNIGAARRYRLSARPSLLSPTQVLGYVADLLAAWEQRARERRMLAEMSTHMLKDLGITRSEARAESEKPFWRG
jgi:uncharacterized protein YjiS (DUF1127 family)